MWQSTQRTINVWQIEKCECVLACIYEEDVYKQNKPNLKSTSFECLIIIQRISTKEKKRNTNPMSSYIWLHLCQWSLTRKKTHSRFDENWKWHTVFLFFFFFSTVEIAFENLKNTQMVSFDFTFFLMWTIRIWFVFVFLSFSGRNAEPNWWIFWKCASQVFSFYVSFFSDLPLVFASAYVRSLCNFNEIMSVKLK